MRLSPAASWLACREIDDVAEDTIGGDAGDRRRSDAEVGVERQRGGGEAGRGADQHQALEAEIDDAGALADKLAERGGIVNLGLEGLMLIGASTASPPPL